MTRNELDEILKAHKKWVKNEKGGRRADFRGDDLSDCRQSCDIPCWKVDHGLLVEPPRWISVEDRLPKEEGLVLVIANGKPMDNITLVDAYELGEYTDEGWIIDAWPGWEDAQVTHWMPLPEPPKEDNDG